jgi:hypothetical protein
MNVDPDVAAVRAALLPAIARDARRGHGRRFWIAGLLVAALLGGSTAVAAATGVIWSAPKVDASVPAVPEWMYASRNPFTKDEGPVLVRRHPDSLAKANQAMEAKLAAAGVTARCGTDAGHPLACFQPSGELVDGDAMAAAMADVDGVVIFGDGLKDYDIKPLTAAEAHAWLCTHPTQRPGADGGEKAPPTDGYEDC